MQWFDAPVGVPFGNPNYDVSLGGSHDMTFVLDPNTPITQICKGYISDISSPSWGKQVTVRIADGPINGHAYFAILHFSAINPSLTLGQLLDYDQLVGWSGGCTIDSQYWGTSNPTGSNFLNIPSMSSQPQIGIALCDGPKYGGLGWKSFPPIDQSLNPQPVIDNYRKWKESMVQKPNYQRIQFEKTFTAIWPDVDVNSGIAGLAYQSYLNGHDRGPAISREFHSPNWDGIDCIMQAFSGGLYHWINGSGQWFPID